MKKTGKRSWRIFTSCHSTLPVVGDDVLSLNAIQGCNDIDKSLLLLPSHNRLLNLINDNCHSLSYQMK